MRKQESLKHEVKQNHKRIYNVPSNRMADKMQHGYKSSAQAMRLMHYRFIEQNHEAIYEAAEESKRLKEKNAAARKEAYLNRFKCVCGKWKAPPFPTCRDCFMEKKAKM